MDSIANRAKDETFELGLVFFIREKKYELDAGSLEGKYKDWQKKLHPDLVHNKSQVPSRRLLSSSRIYFLAIASLSFEYEIVC